MSDTPDARRMDVPEPRGTTGDLVIDAALATLAEASDDDLDAVLAAGEDLHRTLTARLADLGNQPG
ncbi:MAG: hypothetical protein U0Q21_07295 [Dermatophilaceae bacterium]